MPKEHDNDEIYIKLIKGVQLYRANRSEEAIEHFLHILSEYPDSLDTHYYISIVYMNNNDFVSATKHLLNITKKGETEPDNFQAEVWSMLGICYIQSKSLSQAVDAFKKAATFNPSLRSREIIYLKKFIQESSEPSWETFYELGNRYTDTLNDFRAEEMYMKALEYGGNQSNVINSFLQVCERIDRKRKQTFLNYSKQYIPTEPVPNQSLTWLQSTVSPIEDTEERKFNKRKRWERFFVNGDRILEIQWSQSTKLDINQNATNLDGVLIFISENTISAFHLFRMLKECFNRMNAMGKIIIVVDSPDQTPIPNSLVNMLETFMNATGWTIKETNIQEDQDSFYLVSQKACYEILWQSPLFNSSGYSEEQNHFLDGIRPFPLKVKVFPLDKAPELDQYTSYMKKFLLPLQNQKIQSPIIHYQAAPANALSFPVAPISIARTMFETDTLPSSWVEILNEMTEVWVPSEFNRETFASAGVNIERIKLMPGTLDEDKYNSQNVLPYPLIRTNTFKFLSVFDWSIRKGWDVLLQAYFEEFSEDDDVSLVLKVSKINEPNINPYMQIKDLTKKLGLKKLPHYHIIQENLSEEEMIRLYAAGDCFVLPSRGEGWGRPYMEAMAMEIPTIGTKWSGQQAFMTESNSYLINIEGLVPVNPSGMPAHFHGHRWAEPSVDHLKTIMRHVYNHPAEAKQKGQKARKDLFPRFSRHTIGQQIYHRISELVNYYYR